MYGKKSGGLGGDAGGLFCRSLPQPRRRQLPHPTASLWSLALRAPLQRQTGAALWVPFLICPLGPGRFSLWFGKNACGFSFFAEWQDDEREQWIGEAGCRGKACGGMEVSCKVGWALCLHGQKMGCVVPWTPATPHVQVFWWGMGRDIRTQPHHTQLRKRSLEIFLHWTKSPRLL